MADEGGRVEGGRPADDALPVRKDRFSAEIEHDRIGRRRRGRGAFQDDLAGLAPGLVSARQADAPRVPAAGQVGQFGNAIGPDASHRRAETFQRLPQRARSHGRGLLRHGRRVEHDAIVARLPHCPFERRGGQFGKHALGLGGRCGETKHSLVRPWIETLAEQR